MENIKKGDIITFNVSSNRNQKKYTGIVEYKEQLGFITIINSVQYELKKLINLKKK